MDRQNYSRASGSYDVTYNSKAVAGGPILLTIDFAQIEPVGEGANKTEKLVVHFKENNSKLLVVTPTKWDAIGLIAKSVSARKHLFFFRH